MREKIVVSPDLTPDWRSWLDKKRNIFDELDRQLIRGLETPGSGLTLDQLQLAVEHRNPFAGPKALWTLVDDGRSNADIVASIEAKGGKVSNLAKDIIGRSKEQIPPAGTEYRLLGIRGDEFKSDMRTTRAIRRKAGRLRYRKPPMRVCLLLREKLNAREVFGHRVVVLHRPVRDSNGDPSVLVLNRHGGRLWLISWDAYAEHEWCRGDLFVFLAPEAS